ncbi:hypothetical protein [Vibrio phage VEN]|uniref:Holin n=1 Tax=Vibrio phage VEN TaxID=2059879 RepID=A0A2H5BN32_9CAUD|nr:holin [Vibrio phage VEN]AUG87691.1 hypothetical protein [Vibrio phage VEN]
MSNVTNQVADVIRETLPAAPPVTYVGMKFYGISLPDIVSIATLVYLAIQIAFIIHKWRNNK